MKEDSNTIFVNNPLMKNKSLKRNKGSRFLIPKLRFSNSVEEKFIPYNNENNFKTPTNYHLGRKGFRGKHRQSIVVNNTNKRYIPDNLNINSVSKHRRNTLRKLHNKNDLFLEGGLGDKINPLVEKKLQNLYDKRKDLVKDFTANHNKKTEVKLDMLNLKIKELVHNGVRGLRGSTRKIMNNLNKNLRH
jgi:hypothetical protein